MYKKWIIPVDCFETLKITCFIETGDKVVLDKIYLT